MSRRRQSLTINQELHPLSGCMAGASMGLGQLGICTCQIALLMMSAKSWITAIIQRRVRCPQIYMHPEEARPTGSHPNLNRLPTLTRHPNAGSRSSAKHLENKVMSSAIPAAGPAGVRHESPRASHHREFDDDNSCRRRR